MEKPHPIRSYRKANGVTLETMARAVGNSTVSMSRIERGQQDPPLSVLLRIREASNFAISIDDFPPPSAAVLPGAESLPSVEKSAGGSAGGV